MIKAILHIGAGKCGSSSIQSYLSGNPYFDGNNCSYEYVSIKRNGRLMRAAAVQRAAAKSVYGYDASVSAREFASPEALASLSAQFRSVADDGRVPVMSFEGWMYVSRRFKDCKVFETLDLNVDVIGCVRPQVPWINSCWWQWGAWGTEKFDAWLNDWKGRGLWSEAFNRWRALPRVNSVTFLPTSGDVVSSLLTHLGAAPPTENIRTNSSLSGTVLRLLQKHPDLRRGSKSSAVDFILARLIGDSASATPWVISPDTAARLLEFYANDVTKLSSIAGGSLAADIEVNPAWSSLDTFSGMRYEDPHSRDADKEELESLLMQIFERAIYKEINKK